MRLALPAVIGAGVTLIDEADLASRVAEPTARKRANDAINAGNRSIRLRGKRPSISEHFLRLSKSLVKLVVKLGHYHEIREERSPTRLMIMS